jgi:glycosyltransferase involved in cell wall biosynthesis
MISVIIPNYNTKFDYFCECIDSVVNQTFKEFEIIIVDNGSEIQNIEKYKKYVENISNLRFFVCERKSNKKNLSVALNFAIKNSKHELIARMDADDIMMPNRLEKQYNYFINNDVDILGGQLQYLDSSNVTNHPRIINKEIPINSIWFINHPTVMFKKHKILDIGLYQEEPEFIAEDYELWTRSLKNDLIIHNLNDIVIKYRVHDNNLTFKDKSNPYYESLLQYIRNGYIQYYMELKK